jgi:hypothetical protein
MRLFSDDFMGGGAWPFLVSGVICLVDSDNERDFILLSRLVQLFGSIFLEELWGINTSRKLGHNRSVMPLDVLGCTRATLILPKCFLSYPQWIG